VHGEGGAGRAVMVAEGLEPLAHSPSPSPWSRAAQARTTPGPARAPLAVASLQLQLSAAGRDRTPVSPDGGCRSAISATDPLFSPSTPPESTTRFVHPYQRPGGPGRPQQAGLEARAQRTEPGAGRATGIDHPDQQQAGRAGLATTDARPAAAGRSQGRLARTDSDGQSGSDLTSARFDRI
jgi:hypothetical protein